MVPVITKDEFSVNEKLCKVIKVPIESVHREVVVMEEGDAYVLWVPANVHD